MKWGDLREKFTGVAWKRLTPHEVDPNVSHGHEFQGVTALRQILGTESADRLPSTYLRLRDETDDVEEVQSWAKWYDSRANQPSRSPEWRLYYSTEADQIVGQMRAGDLVVMLATRDRTLLILMAPKGSGREQELTTLFEISDSEGSHLQVRAFDQAAPVDFVAATILESLGIARPETPTGDDSLIVSQLVEELSEEYPDSLPPGATIAALVRSFLPAVDRAGDPDTALMRWIEAEAAAYRAWEDRKISRRISMGFTLSDGDPDVEEFRRFSMSLRQSRVSRAGGALQYHFRDLLDARRIPYVMEPIVDGGESPDFLFPGLREYEDLAFPAGRLRMLAAKFTAKDRWRQVLNEAKRISPKHLLTLEAGISARQLQLMAAASLILVIPNPARLRYGEKASAILSVAEFLDEIGQLSGVGTS